MKITLRQIYLMSFVLLFSIVIATAQESCEVIVQQAIETASENCEGLRSNEACYGNITIDAESAPGVENFVFDDAGDIVSISDLASMRLSSQDNDEWGISLLRLQAYLSDDDTLNNVQVVMFGNVGIQNDLESSAKFELIASANVNVRQAPDGSATITGGLRTGQTVIARGILTNEAGENWIRIDYPDDPNNTHWVIAWALRGDNLLDLPTISQDTSTFNAFEAFYMTSSAEGNCADELSSGMLIQTPEGAGRFTIQVNELEIEIGSTVFITTIPSGAMWVYVIEGDIAVNGVDNTMFATTGTRVGVPLDGSGIVSGDPVLEAYEAQELGFLPLSLLEESIIVPTPLTETEIEDYAQQFPIEGTWSSSFDPTGMQSCADNSGGAETYETDYTFSRNADINSLMVTAPLEVPLIQIGPRTYEFYFYDRDDPEYFRIEVVSDNLITGENIFFSSFHCTLSWTFTLTR